MLRPRSGEGAHMTSDVSGNGLHVVAAHGQFGECGCASGGPAVCRSGFPVSPLCGKSVRLADGRQGVIRHVSVRGVLEIAGLCGTVYSHVDCMDLMDSSVEPDR